jgi:hypothetical protein
MDSNIRTTCSLCTHHYVCGFRLNMSEMIYNATIRQMFEKDDKTKAAIYFAIAKVCKQFKTKDV